MKKDIFLGVLLVLMIVNLFGFISAGQGSANVPISSISLTEQGDSYLMKLGRLTFEFNEKVYAIQVRRINKESVDFLIMTLDMNKQEDISAYNLDETFSLNSNGKKEIDLDKDNLYDISIELNEIISTGKYNSIMFADFSIRKIEVELKENSTKIATLGVTSNVIQETIPKPVVIFNQEVKEQSTFLDKIINWVRKMFK